MKDPKHPTNPHWELFDPAAKTPPAGVELLVVTKYGKLILTNWIPDGIAWGFKPGVPQSVKDREWPVRPEAQPENSTEQALEACFSRQKW